LAVRRNKHSAYKHPCSNNSEISLVSNSAKTDW